MSRTCNVIIEIYDLYDLSKLTCSNFHLYKLGGFLCTSILALISRYKESKNDYQEKEKCLKYFGVNFLCSIWYCNRSLYRVMSTAVMISSKEVRLYDEGLEKSAAINML